MILRYSHPEIQGIMAVMDFTFTILAEEKCSGGYDYFLRMATWIEYLM